jgi:hypothetical protein
MSNQKGIRSLENSILVYSDYKSKVSTNHLTDELKQAKIQELDKQIQDCQQTINELKKGYAGT